VGPSHLTKAAAPLADFRRAEGMDVVIAEPPVAEAIQAAGRRPSYVLIVGDAVLGGKAGPWHVPAPVREQHHWHRGQAPKFAADPLYGDVDGDLVPDVPVGRIPARTAEAVERIARKTVAFERRPAALADLRLLVWAGASGLDPSIDRLILNVGFTAFRTGMPTWIRPWALLGSPGHPVCGWPDHHRRTFAAWLRRGALATVFIGHASPERFHSMVHAGRRISWSAADAREALGTGEPGGPVFLITCLTAQFTRERACLAEVFLGAPGGPVVAIGATAESHPFPNYFTATCVMPQLGRRTERVGDLWLAAQRDAYQARSPLLELALAQAERDRGYRTDVTQLRRDQLLLYAILGDPAVRMKFGRRMKVQVRRENGAWRWRVEKPAGADRLYVGLRALAPALPPGPAGPGPEAAEAAHRKALEAFAFQPVASLGAADDWSGVIRRPGALRLVATGPAGMYVAAGKLRPPATQPAERT